jgi:hypothetical protein
MRRGHSVRRVSTSSSCDAGAATITKDGCTSEDVAGTEWEVVREERIVREVGVVRDTATSHGAQSLEFVSSFRNE